MNPAEQELIRELKLLNIRVDNADSFFRHAHATLTDEVERTALCVLREMDAREKTQAFEEAYGRYYDATK